MTARSLLAPRLAAFAAVVFWGVSFVASKAALAELTPVTLLFLRFTLGVASLYLILKARGRPLTVPRSSWGFLVALGFIGVFFHHMVQVHGLALTTAVRTGWLIGLIPIWSAVLSALFLGESFGVRKTLGLLLGTAGAILVITRGDLSPAVFALPSTRGDLLVLVSTVNWAVYTILARKMPPDLGSGRATAAMMLAGWVLLIPFFVAASGWTELAAASPSTWLAVAFLGIGCSGLGYLFWSAALERIEASQVAAFLHIEPLVTLLAAVTLLGEPVAATTIAGGLLVLAGVLIVQRG